jgi:hypothetical protein
VFVPGRPFQPSLMFPSKAGAYAREELLKGEGASLRQALALLQNIKLVWEGLPGTNTPAYLEHS